MEEMDMVDSYRNMDYTHLIERINPEVAVDLVIDHSVQDYYGKSSSYEKCEKRI